MDIHDYHRRLVASGIKSIDDLALLNEEDLGALGIAEESRGKLQDVISIFRLFQLNSSPYQIAEPDRALLRDDEQLAHQKKRRYRRHPKRDPNAPKQPPSAYFTFATEYRRDYVEDQSKFVDIAKAVGQAWQAMAAEERAQREAAAALLKEEYRRQMEAYKETPDYKAYQQYLQSFEMEERSKPSTSTRSSVSRNDGQAVDISKTAEIERALASLSLLATLSLDESQTIKQIVQSSVDRQLLSPSTRQETPFRKPPHDEYTENKAYSYINEETNGDVIPSLLTLSQQLASDPQSRRSPHVSMIIPFHLQPEHLTFPFLVAFLERVNSVLFLFDEKILLDNLHLAYHGEAELDTQVMCELCLCLAIGAQWIENSSMETALLWYENGRRFLDDHDWDHEPWVMRAMTLVSIYHMSTRLDTARHYLHVGARIAQANGFFEPSSRNQSPTRDHRWLHIWSAITIIDCWTIVTPISASLVGGGQQSSIAIPTHLTPSTSSTKDVPFRFFYELSSMFRSMTSLLSAAALGSESANFEGTLSCLERLESWRQEMPENICQFSPVLSVAHTEHLGSLERSNFVNLQMVSMYLGMRMRLSFPALARVVEWLSGRVGVPPTAQPGKAQVRVAGECLKVAAMYASFCTKMLGQGFFGPNCWLSVRLLFDAAMIGLIAQVWQIRARRHGALELPSTLDGSGVDSKKTIEDARAVLNFCSVRNSTALYELKYILLLEHYIT